MIALVPAEADAQRLAMDGGEPVEELHLTLVFLGKADEWDQAERLLLASEVAKAVEGRQAPYVGDAFHVAHFNPGGEEPALVYGVGGEDVERAHRIVAMVAGNTFGPKIPEQHKPWVAHVTAAYTKDLDAHRGLVGNLGRITFDRVRLAFGGEVIDIQLREAQPLAEAAEEVPAELGDFGIQESLGDDGSDVPLIEFVDELQASATHLGDAHPVQDQAGTDADVDMVGLVAAMGVYAPIRWRGPLAPIGTPTGDQRIFPPDRISQASFPQPFRWQEHGMPGHGKAVVVGSILHAEETTWNGEPAIVGHGIFLNPDIIPEVTRAVHLVENGVSGPSVDLDKFTAGVATMDGKEILVVLEARQRGATLVSIPAFADLRIELEYPEDNPVATEIMDAMISSAANPGDHMARVLPITVEYPQDVEEPVDGLTAAAVLRDAAWESLPPIHATRGGITFATTKTSGWQSAPIAPRSATFDADDAVKRIQAWAGIGTEDADESKFRSMFLWAKPEALDKNNTPLGSAGYRLPWGDIFDGKPYLVYHAVYAAAALLEGGHGGLPNIPDPDKAQLRNTITKIYARMAEAFDDPAVRASWDKRQEASSMAVETFEAEELADFSRLAPVFPSERVFAKRDLKGPTKPVVEADGTYYGHMSLWKGCHMGHSQNGVCVKPVHSKKNYEPFYTGTVMTAEGTLVKVGKIMGDGDHAGTRGLTASQVKKYYENTATTFGIVRLYKDKWGIQFAGVTVPEVTAELAQNMRRSEISPHWHPIDGHLEVVAAIAVNRPAFGITASAAPEDIAMDNGTIVYVEDGVQTGLIASAAFDQEETVDQMATGGGDDKTEDCGCGMQPDAGESRAARIMGYAVLPTHAELQARQARLNKHLGV
jgi:2'-5' RNA ligase